MAMHLSPQDLTDEKPVQSEVHKTYIKLSWQNLICLASILGTFVVGYMRLTASDAAQMESLRQTNATLDKVISIQDRQQDWMTDIAVKVGVPTPPRRMVP